MSYIFDAKDTTSKLIEWIRGWFEENGKDCNAVIGISGGKDSSVCAALCVEALGKDRVIGVLMPNLKQDDIADSYQLVEHLGIKSFTVPISAAVADIHNQLEHEGIQVSVQATTNLPPRVRMSVLYAVSQSMNGRVINTCNDVDYRTQTTANTDKVMSLREEIEKLSAEVETLTPDTDVKTERRLLKRLLTLEKLDKALVDCLVKTVEIYSGGKIHVVWKFSYFCDIMNSAKSQTEADVSKTEISNRVWLYYCSADGWDKLNEIRQRVSDCASKMGLSVIGESFDNAGISITATGFKEMQRAVRQGRVDKVIVPTLEGVAKTTEAYAALERAILKRKVKLYDMHGNLIIGV